jgi:hypothetical protein
VAADPTQEVYTAKIGKQEVEKYELGMCTHGNEIDRLLYGRDVMQYSLATGTLESASKKGRVVFSVFDQQDYLLALPHGRLTT